MRALFIMYYFKMAIKVYNAHTRLFYFKKHKAQNAEKLRNKKQSQAEIQEFVEKNFDKPKNNL